MKKTLVAALTTALVVGAAVIGAVDLGLCALGSFMGALASGKSSRESLLTVVFFPLIIPVLLSGIKLLEAVISGEDLAMEWLGLAVAFAAVFCSAALVLFSFIYTGEE